MAGLGVPDAEPIRVGGRRRLLHLDDATEDPLVAGLSLKAATEALEDAMRHLPELAEQDERRPGLWEDGWRLDLDHQLPPEEPVLPAGLGRAFVPAQVAPPLSTVLEPMRPDRLTSTDDPGFLEMLHAERNLPAPFRTALAELYGGP
jgi:5-methylthioadenosine/S-adenosylhomocysteine deaminase